MLGRYRSPARGRIVLVAVLVIAASVGWILGVPTEVSAVPSCYGFAATITGTAGPDTIIGTPDLDIIVGRGGADYRRTLERRSTFR